MNLNNIHNFCSCNVGFLPKHKQFNQKNILCGSKNLKQEEKEKFLNNGFILDETGNNISYLNYTFAELTCNFYVWKNVNEEIISLTHYRRFWNEEEIRFINFDKNSIYCVRPENHNNFFESAAEQFQKIHGPFGLETLTNLSKNNYIFLKVEHIKQLDQIKFVYPNNMFITHKALFDKICEIHFDTLFALYSSSFLYINQLNDYQRRFIGFLSERILTILFMNHKYYFGENIKLNPVGIKLYK